MLFPFEQSKPTTPPKGSRKFLFKSRPRKRTRMLGFASRTPIATNRAMIGPQLRQSKQASFTQRKVLVPTFKRREETQVLGLRGGTNHPQKLRPKVYLLPTPTKNTFFFGFHASENINFQQRRERRCQYARFFFFRIC